MNVILKQLDKAVCANDYDEVKSLITQLTPEEKKYITVSLEGDSLLAQAIRSYYGNLEMIQLLIEQSGADLNAGITMDGALPLDVARLPHVMKFLVEQGADPNKCSRYILHQACSIGDIELVQCLVQHGVDVYKKNDLGESAIELKDNAVDRFTSNFVQRKQTRSYMRQVMENPMIYQTVLFQKTEQKIAGMSVEELKGLYAADPKAFSTIIKLGLLVEVFKRLPYENQLQLYKNMENQIKPTEKKGIQDIIRQTRRQGWENK